MVETTDVRLGERKEVAIKIRSVIGQAFTVTDATFSLNISDETESSGECSIEQVSPIEVNLIALVEPMRKNTLYDLTYHYTIEPEKLIHTVKVRVS